MQLASFILEELQPLLKNWDANARAVPTEQFLDRAGLRDHAEEILREIARDMRSEQSPHEQRTKSEGNAPVNAADDDSPAQTHGTGRFEQGFDLAHMAGEYRALRATVMRQWSRTLAQEQQTALDEIVRFNEALDQALAESISGFTEEHQQAITARLMSEARYRTLFDWAPYGIVVANPEGMVTDANATLTQLSGYTGAELLRLHGSELIATAGVTDSDACNDLLSSEIDHRRECHIRCKDGVGVPVEVVGASMPDGNSLAFVRDISQRKKDEDQIRRLNETLERRVVERTRELEEANQQLTVANQKLELFSTAVAHDLRVAEASDRMKSSFLATVSHELRTPLNSIIGFTDLVLGGMAGPVNPEQERQLGMAQSSARHLLALINDVLDFSKLEAGQFEARGEAFDVRAAVERVIASMQGVASAKNLSLHFDVAPELRGVVTDRRRVEQILLNLISNALKFTEHGGVSLTVETPTEVSSINPVICFKVTDTGIGVRPDDMPSLFKPFQQLDNGHPRNDEGTGLGLVISQRLAALLGGEVTVESRWKHGSTFSLTIPLVRADEGGTA